VRKAAIFWLGAAFIAVPATAQPVQFSAVVRDEVGYGTNPFLRPGVDRGALLDSVTISPRLTYLTARSTTVLSGNYNRDQYFSHLGHTDSMLANITRTDKLSAYLTSTLSAEYHTTNRAIVTDQVSDQLQDPLNIGRRTHGVTANYGLQWQPTAADQITYGAQYQNLTYGAGQSVIPGAVASSYDQYAVNAGYSHAVDARTSIGAQASVSAVRSKVYPDSRAIQPSLTAKRQINAIWNIEGHVGLVLQTIYGPFGRSSTTLGFGVTLCGVYPRTHLCLTAQRVSAPSGYGGLRISTGISGTLTHDLDARSRVRLNGSFTKSSSDQVLTAIAVRQVRAIVTTGEYDHDLTQRISAGVGGRYQWRDSGQFGTAKAVAGTVHISAKLGRI
jgi:hypothetical protein